jgi:2-iminobutanoate/2-iminopropanoate deaminase
VNELSIRKINSLDTPRSSGGYSQAIELSQFNRLLLVSGQIPESVDGLVPESFDEQCRLVWRNVIAQLEEAGMTINNLVKITTFLSSRQYADSNSKIRREILGDLAPALTVILTGIYDESWLVEIEAIAAE